MESLVQLLFQVSSRGLPKIWYPFSFVDTKARKNGGKDFRSSYKSCCERAIIKCRLKDLHLCIQNKILQSLKGDRLKKYETALGSPYFKHLFLDTKFKKQWG